MYCSAFGTTGYTFQFLTELENKEQSSKHMQTKPHSFDWALFFFLTPFLWPATWTHKDRGGWDQSQ